MNIFYGDVNGITDAIGVKYLMDGFLKVKDDSTLIYKGLVLPVLGYYMKWPEVGHHTDGWDEYRVSLIGKGFDYQETTISTGDIEWIKAERWVPETNDTTKISDLIKAGDDMQKSYTKLVAWVAGKLPEQHLETLLEKLSGVEERLNWELVKSNFLGVEREQESEQDKKFQYLKRATEEVDRIMKLPNGCNLAKEIEAASHGIDKNHIREYYSHMTSLFLNVAFNRIDEFGEDGEVRSLACRAIISFLLKS